MHLISLERQHVSVMSFVNKLSTLKSLALRSSKNCKKQVANISIREMCSEDAAIFLSVTDWTRRNGLVDSTESFVLRHSFHSDIQINMIRIACSFDMKVMIATAPEQF